MDDDYEKPPPAATVTSLNGPSHHQHPSLLHLTPPSPPQASQLTQNRNLRQPSYNNEMLLLPLLSPVNMIQFPGLLLRTLPPADVP
ncbi:hypothetical protein TWF173_004588 [Orbilia oligospora]|nr:hypothetical protein TWF173_004588 [Orbilia oligospora]